MDAIAAVRAGGRAAVGAGRSLETVQTAPVPRYTATDTVWASSVAVSRRRERRVDAAMDISGVVRVVVDGSMAMRAGERGKVAVEHCERGTVRPLSASTRSRSSQIVVRTYSPSNA